LSFAFQPISLAVALVEDGLESDETDATNDKQNGRQMTSNLIVISRVNTKPCVISFHLVNEHPVLSNLTFHDIKAVKIRNGKQSHFGLNLDV
jgi:hypothetical protein